MFTAKWLNDFRQHHVHITMLIPHSQRTRAQVFAPLETDPEDCFSCKVTGTFTMIGLGTYAIYERSRFRVSDKRGRLIYGGFSVLLYGLGLYRATM